MRHLIATTALAFACVGCTTVTPDPLQNAPAFALAPKPSEGGGVVYLYRAGAIPTTHEPQVRINGKLLFAPVENAFTWARLAPGKHQVLIDWPTNAKTPDLAFEVEVPADQPLFIKLTGEQRVDGQYSTVISRSYRMPPDEARAEMTACCKYVAPQPGF